MILRLLRNILFVITLLAPVLLPAQAASASEEERLEKLMADSAQWYVPRNHVSVGFRVLSSGGKVTFGNLGIVPFEITVPEISQGAVGRAYNNGTVNIDAPRPNESDANGVQNSTPGTRYAVNGVVTVTKTNPDGTTVLDENGNAVTQDVTVQVGDFIAYTPGLSRNWSFQAQSQVQADGRIAMSTYSASSDGASRMKETGVAGGVEFQFVRTMSNPNARVQFGLMTGIALNGINSKVSGSVLATLNTRTDIYSLNGQAAINGSTPPTAPYAGVTAFGNYITSVGTTATNGQETGVPINSVPDQTVTTSTPGGINVDGRWQIKGAYYMMRLGPSVRAQLSSHLGLTASAGLAGAYAGTTYSVAERFQVPDVADTFVGGTSGVQESHTTKFLTGYFADFNLEWAASERTGLFTGITAQKFDGYNQEVGGRTARIDLGSAVGLRGGISFKF
ncbi:MAG TPA: hypothetical protein VF388_09105 [Lacunisphaera sp.]